MPDVAKNPPAGEEKRYDVKINDRILTPVNLARLKRLIAEGRLKKYHRVRVTGLSRWKKAATFQNSNRFSKRVKKLHCKSRPNAKEIF